MDDSSSDNGNWELTKEAFDKLLARLDPDPDKASEKFEVLFRKLERFFEWRNCPDPETHAWETIKRVCRKLMQGQIIDDVIRYAYGVAKLVYLEILKKLEREREALENMPPPAAPPDESQDSALLDCFESCLKKLLDKDRYLIIRYYQEEKGEKIKNRKQLAEEEGIPLNALRIRVHRIRQKLEKCIKKCLDRQTKGETKPDF